MSHFGPPDSIRRRVGRPLSRRGAWPRFSEPARRAGRPFTRLSGLFHRSRESMRKAAFARNASARLWKCPPHHRTCRNPENRDLKAFVSWGAPNDEPFRATRQHSTTRGEAPFQRGPGPDSSEPATRAGRPFVWPLTQGRGGAAFARNASARLWKCPPDNSARTGRKAICQAVWPLPQRQGEQEEGRFCTKCFC